MCKKLNVRHVLNSDKMNVRLAAEFERPISVTALKIGHKP